MADTATDATQGPQTPLVAEHDGWRVESASSGVLSSDELTNRLKAAVDTPSDDAPMRAVETKPAADPAPAEKVDPDPATAQPEQKADEAKADEKDKPADRGTKRVQKIRSKIGEATFELRETERRIQAAKEELAALDQAKQTRAASPQAQAGKPDWDKYQEEGKTYQQFMDDRDAWLAADVESRLDAKRATDLKNEQQRLEHQRAEQMHSEVAHANGERMSKAAQDHPDFNEVIQNVKDVTDLNAPFVYDVCLHHPQGAEVLYYLGQHPDEAQALVGLRSHLTMPMMDAVQASEDPIPLLSHLAKNPGEAARIAALPPSSALVALGRLMSQLEGASPAGSPPAAPAITQAAPPPSARVSGARNVGGAKTDPFAMSTDQFSDYVREQNARDLA